jgi:hypothetical protein
MCGERRIPSTFVYVKTSGFERIRWEPVAVPTCGTAFALGALACIASVGLMRVFRAKSGLRAFRSAVIDPLYS